MLNPSHIGPNVAKLKRVWDQARRTVLLMIGIPDYDRYVHHTKAHHPDQPVMTYEEFFRNRQECRYGDGRMGRCC